MSSMLQDDHADNQRGIVSTNSINWDKFNEDLFSISFSCEKKFSQVHESKPGNS